MKRALLLVLFFAAAAAQGGASSDWRARVAESMPLLGHRNWILVVDSAYPLQTSPGVETIESNTDQIEVVQTVLDGIHRSIHVRPDIFMDAELPFVSDQDAPGASSYRARIGEMLRGYNIRSLPHEKLISTVDQAGRTYHILVIKTNMTIPYSSVFIQLNCKYWSDDAEARLRTKMSGTVSK
jgi:hypothetical protein